MARILFIITKGFEKSGGATRAMQFASLAAEQGSQVEVALVDDAVHWAQLGISEGIRSTTGESMSDMIENLIQAGGKLHVCKACAEKRYLDPDEFVNNAEITSGPDIVKLMIDPSVKVISF